jgi:hypothetical protein
LNKITITLNLGVVFGKQALEANPLAQEDCLAAHAGGSNFARWASRLRFKYCGSSEDKGGRNCSFYRAFRLIPAHLTA